MNRLIRLEDLAGVLGCDPQALLLGAIEGAFEAHYRRVAGEDRIMIDRPGGHAWLLQRELIADTHTLLSNPQPKSAPKASPIVLAHYCEPKPSSQVLPVVQNRSRPTEITMRGLAEVMEHL